METIKFLTGALIFGAFLAGIVVMLLAVLWMVGKSQQGKEDNDEHAEARSRNRNRNRKPTYVYSLSCLSLTGVKEDEPPRVPHTLVRGTAKTLDAARDEALKLLLPNNEVQAFGVGRKRRYVFYPEETRMLGGCFTCTCEVLGAADEVIASTQWTARYGVVE